MAIHFNKPPIQEALIDIQVEYGGDFSPISIDLLHKKLEEKLPIKEGIGTVSLNFKEEGARMSQGLEGFALKSGDGSKVLQVTRRGFTFSKINYYTNWEDFQSEAKLLWEDFFKALKPLRITRVGVRFINKILIPIEQKQEIDVSEYFNIRLGVKSEEKLPTEFFTRVVYPALENSSIVTFVMSPSLKESASQGFILDIDVFKEIDVKATNSLGNIEDVLTDMRVKKNHFFKSSITKKTEELFK